MFRKTMIAVLLILCVACSCALAATFTIDGAAYDTAYGGETECMLDGFKPQNSSDVIIPETVSYEGVDYTVVAVNQWAFNDEVISSVTFPATIRSLGIRPFIGSTAEKVTFLGANPPSFNDTWASESNITKVAVPHDSVDAYKNALKNSGHFIGKTYVYMNEFVVCGDHENGCPDPNQPAPAPVPAPETGDGANLMLYAALLPASVCGIIFIRKNKAHSR